MVACIGRKTTTKNLQSKADCEIQGKNTLNGKHLLGFGDGYIDISAWKRERLVSTGAALMIPDYCELHPLLAYLLPS